MSGRKRINFTETDKHLLLSVIEKYMDVIENKSTKSSITKIKRVAWDKITAEYNCQSETGPRLVRQLRVLWDNLKRSTRKSVAAKRRIEYELSKVREHKEILHHTLKVRDAQKNVNDDKSNIVKTGGGPCKRPRTIKPRSRHAEIREQVEPLENPLDITTADYFDESVTVEQEQKPTVITPNTFDGVIEVDTPSTSVSGIEETIKKRNRVWRARRNLQSQFYATKLKLAQLDLAIKQVELSSRKFDLIAKRKEHALRVRKLKLEINMLVK